MINLDKPSQSDDLETPPKSQSTAENMLDETEIPSEELIQESEQSPKEETGSSSSATWIERCQLIKEMIITTIIVCLVSSIIFVFQHELQREPVVIEPFLVPDSLTQQGYSGAVLASRLMDQLSANREDAYNRLPDNQKYLFPVEVTNSDLTDSLKLDIPETGVSINIIIQYIRRLRGLETRINGDLVGDKDAFELTIRVNGKTKTVNGNIKDLKSSLDQLADFIIENTQPYFLALHYYAEKDYDKALDTIQKTLHNKDKRDDSFAYDLWGKIFADKKQYEKAIEKYNESIKINPYNDSPYIGLGYVNYKGYKKYEAAIRNYQIVIKRNPKNYSAYNDLALVLEDKGDLKAAIENYKKAIAANPDYANAYYNLGLILLGKNDLDQAIVQFRKITELPYHPGNHFKGYNGLCYALSQQKKYTEAISNCELGIKIKPKDDNVYDTLGTVYVLQKDYDKALLNYQIAVGYNAENSEAQQHLAEVLAVTSQCADANKHLKLALALDNSIDPSGVKKHCEGNQAKTASEKSKVVPK